MFSSRFVPVAGVVALMLTAILIVLGLRTSAAAGINNTTAAAQTATRPPAGSGTPATLQQQSTTRPSGESPAPRDNDDQQPDEEQATPATTRPTRQGKREGKRATWEYLAAKGSSVATHSSGKHPSCIAEDAIRQFASPSSGNSWAAGAFKPYARTSDSCYKNCGGGLIPGEPRLVGTHITASNVLYHQGKLYLIDDGENTTEGSTGEGLAAQLKGTGGGAKLRFSGYFPMISGVWPQPVVREVAVSVISAAEAKRLVGPAAAVEVADVGYYQPPTDFMSTYHTVVETVLPAFHRLMDRVAPSACAAYTGRPAAKTRVLTHRPTSSMYGFKDGTCHIAPKKLAQELASGLEPSRERSNGCLNSKWAKMFTAAVGGASQVLGLAVGDAQLGDAATTASVASSHIAAPSTVFFKSLRFGNPTHCEPLWGPDPFYAEALAADQELNVTALMRAALQRHKMTLRFSKSSASATRAGSSDLVTPTRDEAMAEFGASYGECQDMLWRFRSFHIAAALREGPPAGITDKEVRRFSERLAKPVQLANGADALEVIFASRKGDWARYITNEDDVVASLRAHLDKYRHAHSVKLRVVRFGGSLRNQVEQLPTATVFVGNHGANLLPSVYLRPNSGVVTLSFAEPGFYPFAQFPRWLHWRNVKIEQDCNRRMFRGKCKWSSGNNNDARMTTLNIQQMLAAVDEIIAAQMDAAKRKGAPHDIGECPEPGSN